MPSRAWSGSASVPPPTRSGAGPSAPTRPAGTRRARARWTSWPARPARTSPPARTPRPLGVARREHRARLTPVDASRIAATGVRSRGMAATIADLIDRALAGFDTLAATAEPIADEWQYLTDLDTVWRARLRAVARGPRRRARPARRRGRDRGARRRGRPDHGPPPRHRLAVHAAAGRARRARRGRLMRFMDARPDGRAVVYAHIQADPLVARAADLLAAATTTQRLLARAVHERRVDRSRDVADDVPDAVRARRTRPRRPGPGSLRGDPRGLARRRGPRRADAQPVPRGDRGGPDRAAPRGTDRAGPPRAQDPVRRPSRRDPPVRRDRGAGGRGRGLGLQVGRPRDQGRRPPPAGRRAPGRRRRRRSACSWASWSSTPGGPARCAWSGSAARWRSRGSS